MWYDKYFQDIVMISEDNLYELRQKLLELYKQEKQDDESFYDYVYYELNLLPDNIAVEDKVYSKYEFIKKFLITE
ncbi:MAG: hypothetical protein QW806_09200 [Nitrososphaerota archaeon]